MGIQNNPSMCTLFKDKAKIMSFSGIKSSGKVVYFSATFPYLLLITLMIYGLLQDGAMKGLKGLKVLFVPEESFWDFSGEENTISDIQVKILSDQNGKVDRNFQSGKVDRNKNHSRRGAN